MFGWLKSIFTGGDKMSQLEPKPFWGWAIKGLGGILNIIEGFVRDGIAPQDTQLELLEYQVSRLHLAYTRLADKQPRTLDAIRETRSFNADEVIDDSLEQLQQSILDCPSTGEEIDAQVDDTWTIPDVAANAEECVTSRDRRKAR